LVDPTMFLGDELDVIAAVVLGGASIYGGRGSAIGTFMGVIVIQLIHRSIILIGIPVIWQDFIVGIILIIFISMPYLKRIIKDKLFKKKVSDEE
jgi:simple sugar transport system permease protein